MPYDGLFSFLPRPRRACGRARKRWCQCPMTGFFHFYPSLQYCQGLLIPVSMPYDGLFSFLQIFSRNKQRYCRCQCPMTGFFHFYDSRRSKAFEKQLVSMPYDGLFSFLLHRRVRRNGIYRVSMPYDGLFSFLPPFATSSFLLTISCQCPMTGFFHFYRDGICRDGL